MIRTMLGVLGGMGLAFLAFGELALSYPIPGWLYLIGVAVLAVGLIRFGPLRPQRLRLAVVGLATLGVTTLYSVEWTTRKPFLRDLAKVRLGMTEPEVRQIMGQYQEGTGWSASTVCTLSPPAVGHEEVGVGVGVAMGGQESPSHATPKPADGSDELTLPNSLVFRHSNAAKFNSDWGIVSFSGGKVVGVSFNAD